MWNNQEHLEAYLAVPAMGAVLHPLNIRLFPDQLAYIADHAGDKVVIVDGSVLPLLAKVLGQLPQVEHVVVNGPADLSRARRAATAGRARATTTCSPGSPEEFDWVELDDETGRGRHVLHERHHGQPQGRGLQPPVDLPALDAGLHGRRRSR